MTSDSQLDIGGCLAFKKLALFKTASILKVAVLCLQETHLSKDTTPLLKCRGFPRQ